MSLSTSTFIIKDYIVDRKRIGKGAFSSIYKCFKKTDNQTYAVKELILEKNKKKNIKRELNIIRKLNHKHIVKIYDIIIDTNLDNVYIIMDYYECGDLSKFLNKKILKEKFCKKYMKQLAEGLEYLLENHILHRDLKPQNILITSNFDIKITDFGLATEYQESKLMNTLCGSPMYMAPEIIDKKGYTFKSDLWSVGIIMYEMLHGSTPFNVNNFFELIKEIKKNRIKINSNLSKECINLLNSLLIISPIERINWDDFFNHKWFQINEIIEDENKLMEFDFNNSIPKLENYKINEKQFCSFRHKSIKEEEDNLELNFLEDSLSSGSYKSAEDGEDEDEDEDEDSFYNLEKDEQIQVNLHTKSKPINIKNTPSSFVDDFVLVKSEKNEFILINKNDIKSKSLPLRKIKTLTASLKEYLYSSIKILKHSYDYLNPNSI